MKTVNLPETACCSHCQRMLPIEAFYYNNQTQSIEHCCKECRKQSRRSRYYSERAEQKPEKRRIVITEVSEPETRMWLILQAKQRIREQVYNKRKRMLLEEEKAFIDY